MQVTIKESDLLPAGGKIKESDLVSTKKWESDYTSMYKTFRNVGKVYPAFETVANLATSSFATPISGLIGLASMAPRQPYQLEMMPNIQKERGEGRTFDESIHQAGKIIEAVQKFLIYDPKTPEGQELTQTTTYPLQKLAGAADSVANKFDSPVAGTIAGTAVEAAPMLFGIRKGRNIPKKHKLAVERGINKGVRPSVVKKEMWQQREKYMKNARSAVDDIVKNKGNLELVDREGNIRRGKLPQTLEEFSQAIEQTKRDIFEQYDSLAKQTQKPINLGPIIEDLKLITNDRVLQSISPETVKYAQSRIKALSDPIIGPDGKPTGSLKAKEFSATDMQKMIQLLNQSEKAAYMNPVPEMLGRASVDVPIANNLRAALDAAIEKATGVEYQPLKNRYGALRMLETDVTKRAIVDARKNIKGLIDFSDMFSSHQLVYGVFAGQLPSAAAGTFVKGLSSTYKWINDPNRIVKKMFKKTEKINKKYRSGVPVRLKIGTGASAITATLPDKEQ